jgi:hypothetical protein
VAVTTSTTVVVGGGGCGWWGWYPWYPGYGCGGYYPWCCSYAYSYKTGTVILDMVEALPDDGEEEVEYLGMWSAALNGVVSSSESSNVRRVLAGISTAFAQSPYLGSDLESASGGPVR